MNEVSKQYLSYILTFISLTEFDSDWPIGSVRWKWKIRREMLTMDPGECQEVDADQIVTKKGILYPPPKNFVQQYDGQKLTSSN